MTRKLPWQLHAMAASLDLLLVYGRFLDASAAGACTGRAFAISFVLCILDCRKINRAHVCTHVLCKRQDGLFIAPLECSFG